MAAGSGADRRQSIEMTMCVDTRDGQSGSVHFTHSTTLFADAGIGDGAEIDLMVAFDGTGLSTPVVIHWLDWNHFL